METEWLTANEAAQYLKVKPRTLLQWVRERKIPAHRLSGVWRELERAAEAANVGHLGTHSFRHTHRSWLDAVGTSVAVQQK